jgi:hypothetical protein
LRRLSAVLRERHLVVPFNGIFFAPSCYCELLAIKLRNGLRPAVVWFGEIDRSKGIWRGINGVI